MRVIFLDIDGVLNAHHNTKEREGGFIGMDPHLVRLFNRIVHMTRAKVVLSSSWRHDDDWRHTMERWGLDVVPFIDRTERSMSGHRGEEIQEWLDRHPFVVEYAIIDDGSDMLPDQPHFKTIWDVGLTPKIAEDIIRHLNAVPKQVIEDDNYDLRPEYREKST